LLPVAASTNASNAPPSLDGLSVPVHVVETLTVNGNWDVATQVTKGRSDCGAEGAIVVGRGVRRVGIARSLERVQHLSVLVEGPSWDGASHRGLSRNRDCGGGLSWHVVPCANGGRELSSSGTTDLNTSDGNNSGRNREWASSGCQRRTVDPWTPPPVESNTNRDLVR